MTLNDYLMVMESFYQEKECLESLKVDDSLLMSSVMTSGSKMMESKIKQKFFYLAPVLTATLKNITIQMVSSIFESFMIVSFE